MLLHVAISCRVASTIYYGSMAAIALSNSTLAREKEGQSLLSNRPQSRANVGGVVPGISVARDPASCNDFFG